MGREAAVLMGVRAWLAPGDGAADGVPAGFRCALGPEALAALRGLDLEFVRADAEGTEGVVGVALAHAGDGAPVAQLDGMVWLLASLHEDAARRLRAAGLSFADGAVGLFLVRRG